MYTAGSNQKFTKLAHIVERVKLAKTSASFNPIKNDLTHVQANSLH